MILLLTACRRWPYTKNRPTVGKGETEMKKGEKRRKELLEIAYRMFLSKGYENTSVDSIIEEAGIAKGTFYHYFESKEQMLEEVCHMMIAAEAENAGKILSSDLPVPEKLMGVVGSFRPAMEEQTIGDTLNRPENVLMHDKVNRRIIETQVPLLSKVVEEGIEAGFFNCDMLYERVRMILIISNTLFDDMSFTDRDVAVFTELLEKLLGAAPGSMEFVKALIH